MRKTASRFKNSEGQTLIEILLYLAFLVPILVVGVDLLLKSGEVNLEAGSKSALQDEARLITNRLAYEIHQASTINTPATFGPAGGGNKLNITVPGPVAFTTEDHEYELIGSDLVYRRIIAATPSAKLNSNRTKVNSLTFVRLGTSSTKPTIQITFELEALKRPSQGPAKQIFETVVGAR